MVKKKSAVAATTTKISFKKNEKAIDNREQIDGCQRRGWGGWVKWVKASGRRRPPVMK